MNKCGNLILITLVDCVDYTISVVYDPLFIYHNKRLGKTEVVIKKSRDTGNIGNRKHNKEKIKTENFMSSTGPNNKPRVIRSAREG